MRTFRAEIQSPLRGIERIEDVVSFSGRDSSGAFGLLAGAERRVTVLSFGLITLRLANGETQYLALPGGVLRLERDELVIATPTFVRSPHLQTVTDALEKEIQASEDSLRDTRQSLRRLDEEILKRMSRLKWGDGR